MPIGDNGNLDFEVSVDFSKLEESLNAIEQRISNFKSNMEGIGAGAGIASNEFANLGMEANNTFDILTRGFAALGGTAAATSLIQSAFSTRSFFQDATAAMAVFLKSSDKAEEHLKQLQDYAWYNVFDFEQLVSASKQLQAFGTSVDDVIPTIDKLSNIAAGTGGNLEEFISIFNKAKSLGKLDARGVQQFAMRGLDLRKVLNEMGEVTSGTTVTFEQLQKAIAHVNSEGGMFAGLMDAQFNNLSSLKGAVEDSISSLMNDLGGSLQDTFVAALTTANDVISYLDDNLEKIGKIVLYVAGAWGAHKAALLANIVVEKLYASAVTKEIVVDAAQSKAIRELTREKILEKLATGELTKAEIANMSVRQKSIIAMKGAQNAMKAMTATMSANIWLAVGVAVVALVQKLISLNKEAKAVKNTYNDVIKETKANELEFVDLMKTIERAEKGTDAYKNAVQKLQKEYPSYIANLKLESATADEIQKARWAGVAAIRAEAKEKAKSAAIDTAMSQRASGYNTAVENLTENLKSQKNDKGEVVGEYEATAIAHQIADAILDLDFIELANGTIQPEGISEAIREVLEKFNMGEKANIGFITSLATLSHSLTSAIANTDAQLRYLETDFNAVNDSAEGMAETIGTGLVTDIGYIIDEIVEYEKAVARLQALADTEREYVDANGNVTMKKYLTDNEKKELETAQASLKSYTDTYNNLTGKAYEQRGLDELKNNNELNKMRTQLMAEGYAKERQMLIDQNNATLSEMKQEYENKKNSMSEAEKKYWEDKIKLQEQLGNSELAEMDRQQKLKIKKAKEQNEELAMVVRRQEEDYQNERTEASIAIQNEGASKEMATIRHNAEKRAQEIQRLYEDELKEGKERLKQQWLSEDVNRTELQFYNEFEKQGSQVAKKYAEIIAKAEERREGRTEDANAQTLKDETDFLRQMLSKYEEYTEQKRQIEEQFVGDLAYFEEKLVEAQTDAEKEAINEAINNLKVEEAGKLFDLDMNIIDTSAYDNVAARMADINAAYTAYIERLTAAGASQAELNKATYEWVGMTGKMATIDASIEDWENDKMLALNRGDLDLVIAINAEIHKLRRAKNKLNEDAETTDFKTELLDYWDENDVNIIVDGLNKIGVALKEIGEASGNTEMKDLGEAVEGIGGLVQGFAQGGLIGGIVNAVSMIADEVVNVIVANKKLQKALEQAHIDKWVEDMESMMDSDGIFGNDFVNRVNKSILVIESAQEKLNSLYDTYSKGIYKIGDFYKELDFGNITERLVRTQDRSGFANFFGFSDEFKSLNDIAIDLGRDLYDEYGNLNKDTLQVILDTYEDLGEEDKAWIEEAIQYSEEYAKALENLASYLEDLFGGVADQMADQMIDAFKESGDAAIDFGELVANVGRQMAKDLIKSLVIERYFADLEDDFKSKIAKNGMNAETASYIIGQFQAAMERYEGDKDYWNNVMSSMSDVLNAGDDFSVQAGNLLESASQDSVDLLNGQLNAIRSQQARIANIVDSVILHISSLNRDMNRGFEESLTELRGIRSNGESTNRYFG